MTWLFFLLLMNSNKLGPDNLSETFSALVKKKKNTGMSLKYRRKRGESF